MNDNYPDDTTADEVEKNAEDKVLAAERCVLAAREVTRADPETAFSLMGAAAKYLKGASSDRALARRLRR